MKDKKAVIIIPTHREYFTPDDEISLTHLKKYLSEYDTYFIIPKKISSKLFLSRGFKVKKVENSFFGTVRNYSNLLLTKDFYQSFKGYDFMLIYQLDALVFSDQLKKWMSSGYDYIASPWIRPLIANLTHKKGSPSSGGNGGFCLRDIKKCIKIIDTVNYSATRHTDNLLVRRLWFILAVLFRKSHKIWLNAPALDYPFYEDGFWALEAPKYGDFKVAPFEVAYKFGFEKSPRKLLKLNKGKLPFGVHAWKRYDPIFWEPYIEKTRKNR